MLRREDGRFESKLKGAKTTTCLRLRSETLALLRSESKRLGFSLSELVDVLVSGQNTQNFKDAEHRYIVDQPKVKKYSI